jgi:outer membrane autotransporter protein
MDLKNKQSDKITAQTIEGSGKVNVSSIHLTSNSKAPVEIKVGEGSIVDSVSVDKAETAEATYKLKTSLKDGLLTTVAYGQKAKSCALAAPVAAQLGGYLTQINSYDQAFMNMDMNMTKTLDERTAELSARTAYCYKNSTCHSEAIAEESQIQDAERSFAPLRMTSKTDAGSIALLPSTNYDNGVSTNGKGLWTRPYATFERVNLSNGPKVSNIAYGNFFGGDAEMKQLRNGWSRQFSAYIGYNGSVQDFDQQSIDQNGGTIGVTEVWYRRNFFTGLTVNVSANAVNASTDLGHENFPMLMAGVASKTGYNFEFKQGKFIIQPNLLLSYSFVHTFSHNNGKGMHVGSSPLSAIQVAPGIKFIANLPKGWQPYIAINMRWNILDKTHFSLQDVSIPDMSVNPYVEYGIGVQRKWGERFTGFGQAMIRNGGRNGVMLSFGFKWLIGK